MTSSNAEKMTFPTNPVGESPIDISEATSPMAAVFQKAAEQHAVRDRADAVNVAMDNFDLIAKINDAPTDDEGYIVDEGQFTEEERKTADLIEQQYEGREHVLDGATDLVRAMTANQTKIDGKVAKLDDVKVKLDRARRLGVGQPVIDKLVSKQQKLEASIEKARAKEENQISAIQNDVQHVAKEKVFDRARNIDPYEFWGFKPSTEAETSTASEPESIAEQVAEMPSDQSPVLQEAPRTPEAVSDAEPSVLPPVGEPADDAPAPMFAAGEAVDMPEPLPAAAEAGTDDEIDQAPVWADDPAETAGSGDFEWVGTQARVAEPRTWGAPRADRSSDDEEPGTLWPPVLEPSDDDDQGRPEFAFGGEAVPGGTIDMTDLRRRMVDHDEPGHLETEEGPRISPELRRRLEVAGIDAAGEAAEPAPVVDQQEQSTVSPEEMYVMDKVQQVRLALENLAGDNDARRAYLTSEGEEGLIAVMREVSEEFTDENGVPVSLHAAALFNLFNRGLQEVLQSQEQPLFDTDQEANPRSRGGRVGRVLSRLNVFGRTGTRPRDIFARDRLRAPK